MISGPEAHRIGGALESVAGWTSEIIVVLNEEVRDGTEEIAAKCGAKVFREPWKGHVARKTQRLKRRCMIGFSVWMRMKLFPPSCAMKSCACCRIPANPRGMPRSISPG